MQILGKLGVFFILVQRADDIQMVAQIMARSSGLLNACVDFLIIFIKAAKLIFQFLIDLKQAGFGEKHEVNYHIGQNKGQQKEEGGGITDSIKIEKAG